MSKPEFPRHHHIEKFLYLLERADEPLTLEQVCAARHVEEDTALSILSEMQQHKQVVAVEGDGKVFYARPDKTFLDGAA